MNTNTEGIETMKIEPGYNRVFVERDERRKKEGGILLPEQFSINDSDTGMVVEVGQFDAKYDQFLADIRVGTRIIFAKDAGTPITIKNEEVGRMLFIPEIMGMIVDREA